MKKEIKLAMTKRYIALCSKEGKTEQEVNELNNIATALDNDSKNIRSTIDSVLKFLGPVVATGIAVAYSVNNRKVILEFEKSGHIMCSSLSKDILRLATWICR